MRSMRVAACVALGLAAGAGCSSAESSGDRSRNAASYVHPYVPVQQDQGWAALVEADRQIVLLTRERDAATDPFVRSAMTHQIAVIVTDSSLLMNEMTAGDGQVHDGRIRQLVANLQRATSTGVAQMQAENR